MHSSTCYARVGTQGLTVRWGLTGMIVLILKFASKALPTTNATRLSCLSLFWHFLDVIWIFVFTIVYLMGVL